MYGACADVTSYNLQSTVKQCDGLIGSLLHFLLTAFAVVYIGVANIAGWSRNGQADLVNCLLVSVSGPFLTINKDKSDEFKNSDNIGPKMVHICARSPFLNQKNMEQNGLKTS